MDDTVMIWMNKVIANNKTRHSPVPVRSPGLLSRDGL